MRAALIALALTLVATQARAADVVGDDCCSAPQLRLGPVSDISMAQALVDQHRAGVAMKISGIVLTVLGTAATAYGAFYVVKGLVEDNNSVSYGQFNTAAVALGVGQGAAIAGITLWAVGGARESKANRAHVQLTLGGIGGTF